MHENPRVMTDRTLRRLKQASQLVTPRVHSAFFRSVWNGWGTERRFGKCGLCRFGCSGQDSIEHYFRCPVIKSFFESQLKLQVSSLSDFLGLGAFVQEGETVVRLIGLYAVYSSYNSLRYDETLDPCKLLKDFVREAVVGHTQSQKWLTYFQSGFRSPHPNDKKGASKRKRGDDGVGMGRNVRGRGAEVRPPNMAGAIHSSTDSGEMPLWSHFYND